MIYRPIQRYFYSLAEIKLVFTHSQMWGLGVDWSILLPEYGKCICAEYALISKDNLIYIHVSTISKYEGIIKFIFKDQMEGFHNISLMQG